MPTYAFDCPVKYASSFSFSGPKTQYIFTNAQIPSLGRKQKWMRCEVSSIILKALSPHFRLIWQSSNQSGIQRAFLGSKFYRP